MTAVAKIDTVSREAIHRPWAPAALACMGVVFGDIGTSPLYTFNVAARAAGPSGHVSPEAVLGTVSLIFWSLIIVISIKYAILIMRADNHGEGGILALLALVSPRRARQNRRRAVMVVVGLIGATLLYGDGAITPAISVLSAIEGVKIYAPQMGRIVVPLTVAILVVLFLIQRRGTSFIGGLFGPVMLIWFIVAGALGIVGIVEESRHSRRAQSPAGRHLSLARRSARPGRGRRRFPGGNGRRGVLRRHGPFRPISDPHRMVRRGVAGPHAELFRPGRPSPRRTRRHRQLLLRAGAWVVACPAVVLATVATVIASQSIISGAYSLTQQAINLGFLPRMNIVHTAGSEIGQIYVPFVNWTLAAGTLAAVLGFGSSAALAGAYGIAVSLLMVITTLMATFVALHWKHNRWIVYAVNGSLLALDLFFFASTSTKLVEGGWFPLLIAFVIAFLMLTWRKGEEIMDAVRLEIRERASDFVERLRRDPPLRIPGTAAVLGRMTKGVPLALSHNVKCNRILHENVLLVAVATAETPRVSEEDRVVVAPIAEGVTRVGLRFGFMEQPNVPEGLAIAVARGQIAKFDPAKAIYFTGHETIIPTGRRKGMVRWREALFAFMHHNAQRPGAYFKIPNAQIMEIGIEFEI